MSVSRTFFPPTSQRLRDWLAGRAARREFLRAARHTEDCLRALGDRELRDIGLSRDQIREVALRPASPRRS